MLPAVYRAAEPEPGSDRAGSPTGMSDDATADRRRRFEALFTQHASAVHAYARRRATAADAEEVVADTFLVAWRRLDVVPADALPWLLAVARRTLANSDRGDARRHALRRRLAAQPADQPASSDADPPALERALAALPPAEREAITLLAWDELTPDEIAVVLGCSRGAIYLRLSRARRRLRASVAGGDVLATAPIEKKASS